MTRHRQKDEEAGAEGCGVLNTRKYAKLLQDDLSYIIDDQQAHVERPKR